jgi:hypothetical protein
VYRLSILLLAVGAVGCSLRADERTTYVEEMNAVCRSARERSAAIGPASDPGATSIDEGRVKRVNAAHQRANAMTWAELRAVDPPASLARAHQTLLDAVRRLREASIRLSTESRKAAEAYERGTAPSDEGAVSRTFDAWQAAQERADRAAARLHLTDCRAD